MKLDRLKQNWEVLAQTDPMWAILSNPSMKGRRWDPAAFFQSGEAEIADVMAQIMAAGFPLRRGAALDFGCGLGRLTQALCKHFDACYGVDISSAMLEQARQYNHYGDRCVYLLNETSNLQQFEDKRFDFIYSNIVLQHMPLEASTAYLSEFVRVLGVGGLLIFQIPSALRSEPEKIQGAPVSTPEPSAPARAVEPAASSGRIPHLLSRLKAALQSREAKPQEVIHAEPVAPRDPGDLEPLIDMYAVPKDQVVRLIKASGGVLLRADDDSSSGPEWISYRYWVTKS